MALSPIDRDHSHHFNPSCAIRILKTFRKFLSQTFERGIMNCENQFPVFKYMFKVNKKDIARAAMDIVYIPYSNLILT